ncbi:MAG TPA: sulfotransferase, partial [Caulobacteraceae bacterium]|nr:sulfotransferase [Caulobacteraceae bacterium]
PQPSDPRRLIFFVGFPRSGTTLLEQILASHPDVLALDERHALAEATRDLFVSDPKLERLRTITAEEAQVYREGYWRNVAAYCPDVAGKVFVDKYPLNSERLPLIAKLFPEARILFALRDPRDVVLSCFRRRFEMNPAMYEFCTLEGAAALYDAVMRLVERYKAVLALPLQYVRHERVVEDLRGEVGAVCDFIGVEWDDAMLDFAQTARRRGVRTPSAGQVVRGLYDEGIGHWRNYRAELASVMPLLAPWVEAFGYPAD